MTNQEKMQKIYELTGVEPKIKLSDTETMDGLVLLDNGVGDCWQSYPCEQLWEMLRVNNIKPSENHLRNMKAHLWTDEGYVVLNIPEIDMKDLHTALLDMVLWCIENGYVKPQPKHT